MMNSGEVNAIVSLITAAYRQGHQDATNHSTRSHVSIEVSEIRNLPEEFLHFLAKPQKYILMFEDYQSPAAK